LALSRVTEIDEQVVAAMAASLARGGPVTSTRGVRARIRRVAGCATPIGSAGHAGATANLKLTFHLDHSAGADQVHVLVCVNQPYEAARSLTGAAWLWRV
jgi:hypothetical protein